MYISTNVKLRVVFSLRRFYHFSQDFIRCQKIRNSFLITNLEDFYNSGLSHLPLYPKRILFQKHLRRQHFELIL